MGTVRRGWGAEKGDGGNGHGGDRMGWWAWDNGSGGDRMVG